MDDTAATVTFRGRSPWPSRRVMGLLGGVGFLAVALGVLPTRFAPASLWGAMAELWRAAEGFGGMATALVWSILIVAALVVWGLLLLGGIAVLVGSVWSSWRLRRTRVRLSAQGCEVFHGRRRISIPWSDVAYWRFVSQPFNHNAEEGVIAVPAEHVTDPDAPPRRAVWSRADGHWVLCMPFWFHATRAEVDAAMRRFAGEPRA